MAESPSQMTTDNADQEKRPLAQDWRKLIDNPWLMIAMLFLVTAALGLPFLWLSRGFSSWAKIVLTLAVLAYTALVFWVFFLIMAWCWSQIEPALT